MISGLAEYGQTPTQHTMGGGGSYVSIAIQRALQYCTDEPSARVLLAPRNSRLGASRSLTNQVKETGAEVTITRYGHPVAKLVPVAAHVTRPTLLGSCKGSLIILDDHDLVPSTTNEWTDWRAKIEQRPGGATPV